MFQNPDGIVVKQVSRTRASNGIYVDTLPLSEIVKWESSLNVEGPQLGDQSLCSVPT